MHSGVTFRKEIVSVTILALVFCVIAGFQNRSLANRLKVVNGALSGTAEAQRGDIVPPFEARAIGGGSRKVEFSSSAQRKVVFIYSSRCRASRLQMSRWWRRLVAEKPASVELLAISLDRDDEDGRRVAEGRLDAELLLMPDLAVQRAYRVTSVPELLVVSPEGRVERVWYGLLRSQEFDELIGLLQQAHSGKRS